MDKGLDINLIPYEVALQCPIQLFQRRKSLVQSYFDLATSRIGINDITSMVRKARTSEFLTISIASWGYFDYCNDIVFHN
jgi:hypothetical protein